MLNTISNLQEKNSLIINYSWGKVNNIRAQAYFEEFKKNVKKFPFLIRENSLFTAIIYSYNKSSNNNNNNNQALAWSAIYQICKERINYYTNSNINTIDQFYRVYQTLDFSKKILIMKDINLVLEWLKRFSTE